MTKAAPRGFLGFIVNFELAGLNLSSIHGREEGKVQGHFIGTLADEWNLSEKPILKSDPRFRWFAEVDIGRLSGKNLKRPRKSERQAMEFVYSAPKSAFISDDHSGTIYELSPRER